MAFGNPFTRWVYDHSPMFFRSFMATVYSRGRGQRKFGPKFEEHLADLERTQWYAAAELRALQEEKLRRVLWQAERHVPFYRGKFAEWGVTARQLRQRSDLTRLPIVEKSTVQANPATFRSALYLEPSSVEIIHSSGTTGKAIDVAVEAGYLKLEKAFLWLQRQWCGVKPGDRTAYFTGHPVVPVARRRPPFWVFDGSEKRTFFSLQHLSKDNLPAYAAELARFNPLLLVGYPTAIYFMALHLCESGITSVRPRGIFTASETLLPHQREAMERAFGCKVMDLYGQAEYCGMIMQCEQGSYHIAEEYGVLEILGRDGQPAPAGEIGEIVCTGLNNLAMPFIRYRTGDTAVPKTGTCSCGRAGALVERITGRLEDVVVTPDGRFLSRLDFVFKEMPQVLEAQMIQEARDFLRIRIVPRPGFSEADKARITRNLRERAGNEMRFEFELVDHIPRLPNGKFRYVISKVPLEFGTARQTGEVIGAAGREA
ncbi:MAG: phenylacetate--CoA ligase family protein [Verrucomicrobia bacterium]|nr:phenylacetate--CoA ligase family protein [Verrucomicrobiota bacterium]